MKLVRKVQKYNESGCHVTLPSDVCKQIGIQPYDMVTIDCIDGKIIIEKLMEAQKK